MDTMKNDNSEAVLQQWRVRILNVFFGVVAVISLPAIGTIIASAIFEPEFRPMRLLFQSLSCF
jgi:hypothetical protein